MRAVLTTILMLIACAQAALAEDNYPSRPIRIVVGVQAGGPADTLMRMVAAQITEKTGISVVPDYLIGGSGMRAMREVARAPHDGYTLVMGSVGVAAINPNYFKDTGNDVLKEFQAVSYLMNSPTILIVNSKLPVSNVKELVEYIKKSNKRFNFGSSGKGQSTHLAAEIFKHLSGVDFGIVPYTGAPQAVKDLVGGHIDAMFDTTTSIPLINDGSLKVLAVGTAERSPLFPGAKLSDQDKTKLKAMNAQGVGTGPAEAQKFLEEQLTAWKTMISEAGIKGEE